MADNILQLKITTVADMRAAKEVEASLRQQIMAAKAAGQSYAQLEQQLSRVSGGINKAGFLNRAKSEILGAAETVPVLGSAMRSLNGAAGLASAGLTAFAGILAGMRSALVAAARFEDIQAGFTTLLGSARLARERLKELSDFAASTPFQLDDVAAASRTLENLTNGALSTGEGLRMVGDVASGTDVSLREMAVTIGRFYQGLRDGAPVGEMANRLTELTGINFRQVESWDEAREAFSKYAGEMERRSKTTIGVWSTLLDDTNALGRFCAFHHYDKVVSVAGKLVSARFEFLVERCENNIGQYW